jgi:hypothetical protein
MNRINSSILIIWLTLAPATVARSVPSTNPSMPDLFVAIALEDRHSWERFQSMRYEYQFSALSVVRGRTLRRTGDCVVVRRNSLTFTSSDSILDEDSKSGHRSQHQAAQTVVNDKYFAYLPEIGNYFAYRIDFDSPKTMSKSAALKLTLMGARDVLLYGFGDGHNQFSDVLTRLPGFTKWRVETATDSAGMQVFNVKEYIASDPETVGPDFVFTVDPRRGFLITSKLVLKRDGRVMERYDVVPGQVGKDHSWFPMRVDDKVYATPVSPSDRSSTNLIESLVITVRSVDPDLVVPDAQFTVRALGPPPPPALFETGLDGQTRILYRLGNDYVPEALIDQLKQSRPATAPLSSTLPAFTLPTEGPGPVTVFSTWLVLAIATTFIASLGSVMYWRSRRGRRPIKH